MHEKVQTGADILCAPGQFSVNLSDLDAIHIFQCKEGVHKTKIGVNVWNIDSSGAYTEDLCHFFDQISFRGSCFCLVLRHTDIRSLCQIHLNQSIYC